MLTFTEKEFQVLYKKAVPSDFKLGKPFYRMVNAGDGLVRPEAVQLTGNVSRDATKFNDLALRGQAFVATTKAPKSLRSKSKTEPAYKPQSTSELTSPLRKAHRRSTAERSEQITKTFAKK